MKKVAIVLAVYPGKSISFPLEREVKGSMHPISIGIFNVDGKLRVKVTNEHPARILHLSDGLNVKELLKELYNA